MKHLSVIPLIVFILCALGCGSKSPQSYRNPSSTNLRIAVLDGRMAPGKEETRKSIVGSGVISRNRFESGTANLILADLLAKEFQSIPGVQVQSRLDMQAYMADKERLLAHQYPDLNPQERRVMLAEQSPLDYGRSLNVDYVIYPTINKARLTQNRLLQSWVSSVECEVDLYNVESGELVWKWEGGSWKCFASVYGVMEKISRNAEKSLLKSNALTSHQQTSAPK